MIRVAWLNMGEGTHPAVLGEPGRLYTPAAYLDSGRGVRIERVENRAAARLETVRMRGRPYPPRRAARLLLKSGRAFGITDGARELLKEAEAIVE